MIFEEFIQHILVSVRKHVSEEAKEMFVDITYNTIASEIVVVWANHKTTASEIYAFPVMDCDEFLEEVSIGRDMHARAALLITHIRLAMKDIKHRQLLCQDALCSASVWGE